MPLFQRNMDLGPALQLSPWRKIAIGTWRTAGDPSVYGILEVDMGPALAYIEKLRAATGLRITLTHFAGKAIAETLRRHPDINCILRFGRLYPRKHVDVFFQVASDSGGKDLSGMVIRDADTKSIPAICREMDERVRTIREKGDPEFKKMKGMMGMAPGFLVRYLLDAASLLMYALNIWSPLLGSPRDPFGSVMITNIGSLGLDMAFAPLVPYSRVPILIALGAAKQQPIVQDGKITIASVSQICATFDHRLVDGVHGSHMARTFKKIFANPEGELGLPSVL